MTPNGSAPSPTPPRDRRDTPSGAHGGARWDHYRVWQRLAPLGLLLVGAGTAISADASARRAAGTPRRGWVTEGTAGLVLLNAGLSLFGEAVKRRALYDVSTGAAAPHHP